MTFHYRTIYQTSDIHIKSSGVYDNSEDILYFANNLMSIIENNGDLSRDTVILILGDIFDKSSNRLNHTGTLISTFNKMLEIMKDCTVLIIPGNHDIPSDNIDQDIISSCIDYSIHDHVKYFKNQGLIETLELKNGGIRLYHHPVIFPDIQDEVQDIDYRYFNIGLFHEQTGEKGIGYSSRYISEIHDYDLYLCGDAHNRWFNQELGIFYSGAPIQHRMTESLDKYVIRWNIGIDKDEYEYNYRYIRIPNRSVFISVDTRELGEDLIDWIDKNSQGVNIRGIKIKSESPVDSDLILERYGVRPNILIVGKSNESIDIPDNHTDLVISEDLLDIHREYMTGIDLSEGNQWNISRLSWSNVGCYGSGNVVDFSKISGIVQLSGKNSTGKSTFIDILLLGLFGTGIDIKSILNTYSSRYSIELTIESNGRQYRVIRIGDGKKMTHKMIIDDKETILGCKNVQTRLSRIIGIDRDILRHSSLLLQDREYTLNNIRFPIVEDINRMIEKVSKDINRVSDRVKEPDVPTNSMTFPEDTEYDRLIEEYQEEIEFLTGRLNEYSKYNHKTIGNYTDYRESHQSSDFYEFLESLDIPIVSRSYRQEGTISDIMRLIENNHEIDQDINRLSLRLSELHEVQRFTDLSRDRLENDLRMFQDRLNKLNLPDKSISLNDKPYLPYYPELPDLYRMTLSEPEHPKNIKIILRYKNCSGLSKDYIQKILDSIDSTRKSRDQVIQQIDTISSFCSSNNIDTSGNVHDSPVKIEDVLDIISRGIVHVDKPRQESREESRIRLSVSSKEYVKFCQDRGIDWKSYKPSSTHVDLQDISGIIQNIPISRDNLDTLMSIKDIPGILCDNCVNHIDSLIYNDKIVNIARYTHYLVNSEKIQEEYRMYDEYQEDIKKIRRVLKGLRNRLKELNDKLDNLIIEISSVYHVIRHDYHWYIRKYSKDIELYRKELEIIDGYEEYRNISDKLNKLKSQKSHNNKAISGIYNHILYNIECIDKCKSNISIMENILVYKSRISELNEWKQYYIDYRRYSEWLQSRQRKIRYRDELIENRDNLLTQCISSLESICNDAVRNIYQGMQIKIESTDNKYKVCIYKDNKIIQRIAHSIKFILDILVRYSVIINNPRIPRFMIIDEGFACIDQNNMIPVWNSLKDELIKGLAFVIVIDHGIIGDNLDCIKITHEDGLSKLSYE